MGQGSDQCRKICHQQKAGEKGEDTGAFISGGKRYARNARSAKKEFIKRIPDGQLVVVPDIRHEIYRAPNSVLQPYLEMIFEFYDSGRKSPVKKGGSAEVLLSCRRYESKTCCVLPAGVV